MPRNLPDGYIPGGSGRGSANKLNLLLAPFTLTSSRHSHSESHRWDFSRLSFLRKLSSSPLGGCPIEAHDIFGKPSRGPRGTGFGSALYIYEHFMIGAARAISGLLVAFLPILST